MLIRAGVASRDEDKDLRESDDVRAMGFCQLWAKFLFFYRWGTLLCWQLSGDQRLPSGAACLHSTSKSGEEHFKTPTEARLPSQRAPENTALTSCKQRHNAVLAVMVVHSVQGRGGRRRDSTAAGRGGEGAGDCSKARRHKEVRGQADGPGLLLVRGMDHGANGKRMSQGLGIQ